MNNLNVVKEFIDLAKAGGVSELKFENETIKLEVSFNASPSHAMPTHVSYQGNPVNMAVNSKPEIANEKSANDSHHIVKSPLVGTFYASPGPGKANYVKIGDRVKKGQILCILEAMKIMNEIESDTDGEIVEICVDNESLVEFGQALVKIRK